MKPMPWRILVLTEAGKDSGEAIRLDASGADGWLAASDAKADVPKPGGGTVTLAPREQSGFTPAAVSAALGAGANAAAIDAALHAPAFQRLESAWRGLALLAREAGDAVAIDVQSVPRKGLAQRFRDTAFARERTAADPIALIVADYDFSHKGDDLATFAELASMAMTLQAPLVANASAGFFDFRYFVQVSALPEMLPRLNTPQHQAWRDFQKTEPARWAALTINRWLQRAPYAAGAGGHAETAADSNPDSFLWGRGGWLVAAAVARSVKQHGHALALSGSQGGNFSGVATRPWAVNANTTAPLATEGTVAEMAVLELSRAAFTPVIGPLRASAVLLPMVVTTFRLNPGKLTVEGTLAYQLMAGRLAQFCGRLLEEMPAADAATVAQFFRTELVGFLGPLAGEQPDGAVTVELQEQKSDAGSETFAAVRIKPPVQLEGKPIDFEFGLPVRL